MRELTNDEIAAPVCLKDLAEKYGDENLRIQIDMQRPTSLASIGIPLALTSSSDPYDTVLARIFTAPAARHRVEDGHKVTLIVTENDQPPKDGGDNVTHYETYYQSDLMSLIRESDNFKIFVKEMLPEFDYCDCGAVGEEGHTFGCIQRKLEKRRLYAKGQLQNKAQVDQETVSDE